MLDKTDGFQAKWTDTRVAFLKRRWEEGASGTQISNELGGVSRSGVIGKIHREGFQAPPIKAAITRNRPKRQPGWRPVQWRPPLSSEERIRRARERALLLEITAPQPLPEQQIRADFLNITFDQLRYGVCHFPIGEHPPFVYCGRPALRGLAWCASCFRIAHKRAA